MVSKSRIAAARTAAAEETPEQITEAVVVAVDVEDEE